MSILPHNPTPEPPMPAHEFTFTLHQRGPFSSTPAIATLRIGNILANNVFFDGESNPYHVRLWILGDVTGPICAVWADCEQDAWDEACDQCMLDDYTMEESEIKTNPETGNDECELEMMRLGNASEPFHIDQAWSVSVKQVGIPFPCQLRFAEARGAGKESLDF